MSDNRTSDADGPLVVCLPDDASRDAITPLPDGVRVLVWDGAGEPPEGIDAARFLLGAYMAPPMPAASLARMPRLEVIQVLSAGVESWLPLVPDGVTLCNGRAVHGGATAEIAVAGILALLRKLPFYLREQAAGRWSPGTSGDLDGRRVLIVGAGDIGNRIAAALEVFGAVTTFVARTARDGIHAISELDGLLPDADVVVLALPLTDESRGLADAAFLAALPDGAIVANIARGAVLDTDALVAELRAGRLSAFLDVTEPEPLPDGHPLWTAPNLVLTPHIGGGTDGWQRRGFELTREQIERFAAGRDLRNVVGDY